MNNLTVEKEDTFASLLELAANNNVEGFKRSIGDGISGSDEVGLWYGRQKGSKQMFLLHRTPLMVASTYGSTNIVKLILSLPNADVNKRCGLDKTTALHCAASGGSPNAIDVVKLLLDAGADPNLVDANGNCPIHVIVVPPRMEHLKSSLEELLSTSVSIGGHDLRVSTSTSNSNSPPLSPENGSPSCPSDSNSSLASSKTNDVPDSYVSEKKEYLIEPLMPDIKNGIYSTDEFRMFSFKVRPCSRAYSHDWTECPFVHPGENARRRDPRKYHYSCVPCPDFRKGACRRGDMCEYAHGVFESWLHPAQYRTRICKDGTSCNRRVCFFAHKREELRPLYASTSPAILSPQSGSSNAMDVAAAMSLLPGSPSSASMSPSPFAPPLSPSANGILNMGWPQQKIPALHLPCSSFQSSRLRSSLNARDIQTDHIDMLPDFDVPQQLPNELSRLSQTNQSNMNFNHSAHSKTFTPSNLDDLFSAESSSPRYSDQGLSAVFSPTHRSALLNQFQQQKSMLSPTDTIFSPRPMDNSPSQAPFGGLSSGRMSSRGLDPVSPMGSRVSMLAHCGKQPNFRSLSSRDLGSKSSALVGSPGESWSNQASSNHKPNWAVYTDDFGQLRRSSSFEFKDNGEEPDLSWVHSLVKESPQDGQENHLAPPVLHGIGSSNEGLKSDFQMDPDDQSVLGAWLEQLQFDQFIA